MVENMVKEVEITRQVVKGEPGPVNDLLALLQKATNLLQVMAYRLEGQPSPPSGNRSIEHLPPVKGEEEWEKITLVVENATEPNIVFSYTKALGKLDSVRDMKLVSINKSNLLYRVETRSKAKFAREVMSLPDYRPVRIQATLEEITVQLNSPPKKVFDLERLLGDVLDNCDLEEQSPGSESHILEARSLSKAASRGSREVGIDGFFNARHYQVNDGEPGPVEMKSWRVEVSLEGDRFDKNGSLSGLDEAQGVVKKLMTSYNNQLLNQMKPYDQIQPTPDNIARTLYQQLGETISHLPLTLKGIKVWATPTQYVWYSGPPGHAT
jgi:6-pyruvoyltetrahydropterin/6-carboxytetrahydropterin synthase